MSEKPTEDIEWAEGEGAEVAEPENLRGQGWPVGFVPPAEHVNWLQRAAGRWIKWLAAKLENHVHDGGTDPASVAKVDFTDHINYGANGYLAAVDNLNGNHTIHHIATDESSIFTTDALQTGLVQARRLQSPLGDSDMEVLVSGPLEMVNEDEFLVKVLGAVEITKGGTFGDDVVAPNTPVRQAFFAGTTNGVTIHMNRGFLNAGRSGAGQYVLDPGINQDSSIPNADPLHIEATSNSGGRFATAIKQINSGQVLIHVSVFDEAGDPVDGSVSLSVYHY